MVKAVRYPRKVSTRLNERQGKALDKYAEMKEMKVSEVLRGLIETTLVQGKNNEDD